MKEVTLEFRGNSKKFISWSWLSLWFVVFEDMLLYPFVVWLSLGADLFGCHIYSARRETPDSALSIARLALYLIDGDSSRNSGGCDERCSLVGYRKNVTRGFAHVEAIDHKRPECSCIANACRITVVMRGLLLNPHS